MKCAVKGYPGLYREFTGNQGMRFRILINHNKQIIQEYFYIGIAVTEFQAKRAALKRWRELRVLYPVITKRRFREISRKPTSSGITGVTRIVTTVKGYEYEFWKATWTTRRGKRCSRQFSVTKYGEKEAKKLAIAARSEELDKIGAK
jgi:AP2 domain